MTNLKNNNQEISENALNEVTGGGGFSLKNYKSDDNYKSGDNYKSDDKYKSDDNYKGGGGFVGGLLSSFSTPRK